MNDFLAWLNPFLGVIALVLAAMVIAEAAARLPAQPSRAAAAPAQPVRQSAALACPQGTLPPEWR
ncbi:MAG TPA: hypothetical protein VJR30_02395, partial [Bradyrhizobium sp.]|nr:hypothetical protein [Bradyrhizobium sp.]